MIHRYMKGSEKRKVLESRFVFFFENGTLTDDTVQKLKKVINSNHTGPDSVSTNQNPS